MFRKRSLRKRSAQTLASEKVCSDTAIGKLPVQVSVELSRETRMFRKRSLWEESAQALASEKVCSGTALGKFPAQVSVEVSLRTLTKTQCFGSALCAKNLHKRWLPKRFGVGPLSENYQREFL